MKSYTYERFGGLIKDEPLSCIDHSLLMPETCVLESVAPFSGYYNEQLGQKPLYLYLMLEGNYTFWPVQCLLEKARSKAGFYFDATFTEVTFTDHTNCFAIRIRDLDTYQQIAELQEILKSTGLNFKKKTRKIDQVPASIRLEKFFYLDDWGEDLLLDKQQDHHGYFRLPFSIDKNQFFQLTEEVKFDTNLLYFDAAFAYYQQDEQIHYLVRIYKEGLTQDKLDAIRKRYLLLLNRFTR